MELEVNSRSLRVLTDEVVGGRGWSSESVGCWWWWWCSCCCCCCCSCGLSRTRWIRGWYLCIEFNTIYTAKCKYTRNAYHHYRKFYNKEPVVIIFCSYESLRLPLCSRPAGCTRDAASIVAARCRSLSWNRHVQKSALMNACDVPISLPPSILQYSVTERRYHCANHDSRQRYQCLMIPGGLCV